MAVLYGGMSAERDGVARERRRGAGRAGARGVDAHGIDRGADVVERLVGGAFDRAFIILHGRGGEDGTIQGVLETLGTPLHRQRGARLRADHGQAPLEARVAGLRHPHPGLRDARIGARTRRCRPGARLSARREAGTRGTRASACRRSTTTSRCTVPGSKRCASTTRSSPSPGSVARIHRGHPGRHVAPADPAGDPARVLRLRGEVRRRGRTRYLCPSGLECACRGRGSRRSRERRSRCSGERAGEGWTSSATTPASPAFST